MKDKELKLDDSILTQSQWRGKEVGVYLRRRKKNGFLFSSVDRVESPCYPL
jgi:hypothetical protein